MVRNSSRQTILIWSVSSIFVKPPYKSFPGGFENKINDQDTFNPCFALMR